MFLTASMSSGSGLTLKPVYHKTGIKQLSEESPPSQQTDAE